MIKYLETLRPTFFVIKQTDHINERTVGIGFIDIKNGFKSKVRREQVVQSRWADEFLIKSSKSRRLGVSEIQINIKDRLNWYSWSFGN
jgi:hypothetical protein